MVSKETGQPMRVITIHGHMAAQARLAVEEVRRDQILQISPGCLICLGLHDTCPSLHFTYSVTA